MTMGQSKHLYRSANAVAQPLLGIGRGCWLSPGSRGARRSRGSRRTCSTLGARFPFRSRRTSLPR